MQGSDNSTVILWDLRFRYAVNQAEIQEEIKAVNHFIIHILLKQSFFSHARFWHTGTILRGLWSQKRLDPVKIKLKPRSQQKNV